MAYAALLSLSHVLSQIIIHDQYPVPLEKEKLVSLHGNVSTVLTFLEEECSHKFRDAVSLLESRIIDAAYQAEDVIESHYSVQSSESTSSNTEVEGESNLNMVIEEIDLVLEEVMAIKNKSPDENLTPPAEDSDLDSLSTLSLDEVNTNVVGFDDDFVEIKRRVYQRTSAFDIIPIVGMGGMGKSTLARKLYDESTRSSYFDRCAWIVVSQEYSVKDIYSRLIRSIKDKCELHQKNNSQLLEIVYKELFGRRYLIVVDDVWSTKAWDELKLNSAFPRDTKGSRVLLTTRLSEVASSFGSPHEMHFLDDDQSWRLLKDRVFKTESCPFHLEPTGKKIAKSCRGLPLTVVLVSGILKANTTREYWESISQDMSLTEPTIALQCSKVLSLSYENLPLYLKPCFLYVTVFPEDYEIKANRLIRLWMAEGFVKSSGLEGLEDVAEGYLKDLVGRSLLLVTKVNHEGIIKCIRIHDVLRDFGTQKTQQERFHYHGIVEKRVGKERRLSIHKKMPVSYINPKIFSIYDFADIPDPKIRSLFIFYSTASEIDHLIWNFRLLRILDALGAPIIFDPEKLVHLRYLAIKYEDHKLSPLVSKIQNLQTLILHGGTKPIYGRLRVPLIVWTMPSLRHLIFLEDFRLEQPTYSASVEYTNLHTLSLVTNLSITKRVIKMLGNVKKLGLYYTNVSQRGWDKFYLHNLVGLAQVEKLKIIFQRADGHWWPEVLNIKWAFPHSIKELTLDDIRRPWEDMTVVGSLPNLEVLKLRRFAFTGREWNPIEDQFLKLKYLEMVDIFLYHWGAENVHFPELECLLLERIGEHLEEIPSGIWEIDTLKLIHLNGCKRQFVESVMNTLAEQRKMGNEVQVVSYVKFKERRRW